MGSVPRHMPLPVGILLLDEQHAELDQLLCRLLETLSVDPGGALSEFRFVQLAEQTGAHFRAEEDCLRKLEYPDLALHRVDHQKILERTRMSLIRWNAPDAPPLVDLVNEFAQSTQRHLLSADHAFARWLQEQ